MGNHDIKIDIDKMVPTALDAEEAVLGAILLERKAIEVVVPVLKPDNFYKVANQLIYKACIDLHESFSPIDIITVVNNLKVNGKLELVGGAFYITQLTNRVAGSANIEAHSYIILQQSLRRDLINLSQEAATLAYEDSSDVLKSMEHVSYKIETLNSHTLTVARKVSIYDELDPFSDVVTFKDKAFLSIGNVAGVVANPGLGKSNVMDAIAANAVNPLCDGLGFKVNAYGKKIFHADTERSRNDAIKGLRRTVARVDVERYPELIDGGYLKGYDFYMFKEIPDSSLRRNKVQRAIMSGEYKIILLDGLTDFCDDPNSLEEAQKILSWLGAYASKFGVAILVTIHDNPKGLKGSPRGHIGSELHRKVEGLLLIDHAPNDKSVKVITNNFDSGKLRNAGGSIENYFSWDDQAHMFVSIDYKEVKENHKVNAKIKDLMDKVLVGGNAFNRLQLSKKLTEESGKGRSTVYEWIDKAIEKGWIYENDQGLLINGSEAF